MSNTVMSSAARSKSARPSRSPSSMLAVVGRPLGLADLLWPARGRRRPGRTRGSRPSSSSRLPRVSAPTQFRWVPGCAASPSNSAPARGVGGDHRGRCGPRPRGGRPTALSRSARGEEAASKPASRPPRALEMSTSASQDGPAARNQAAPTPTRRCRRHARRACCRAARERARAGPARRPRRCAASSRPRCRVDQALRPAGRGVDQQDRGWWSSTPPRARLARPETPGLASPSPCAGIARRCRTPAAGQRLAPPRHPACARCTARRPRTASSTVHRASRASARAGSRRQRRGSRRAIFRWGFIWHPKLSNPRREGMQGRRPGRRGFSAWSAP